MAKFTSEHTVIAGNTTIPAGKPIDPKALKMSDKQLEKLIAKGKIKEEK